MPAINTNAPPHIHLSRRQLGRPQNFRTMVAYLTYYGLFSPTPLQAKAFTLLGV